MNKEQKEQQNISPTMWVLWLVFSIITGILGSVFISISSFTSDFITVFLLGCAIFIFSFALFLLFLKELIAEANVRALEVYYGKKRKIINDSNKDNNNIPFE